MRKRYRSEGVGPVRDRVKAILIEEDGRKLSEYRKVPCTRGLGFMDGNAQVNQFFIFKI